MEFLGHFQAFFPRDKCPLKEEITLGFRKSGGESLRNASCPGDKGQLWAHG